MLGAYSQVAHSFWLKLSQKTSPAGNWQSEKVWLYCGRSLLLLQNGGSCSLSWCDGFLLSLSPEQKSNRHLLWKCCRFQLFIYLVTEVLNWHASAPITSWEGYDTFSLTIIMRVFTGLWKREKRWQGVLRPCQRHLNPVQIVCL